MRQKLKNQIQIISKLVLTQYWHKFVSLLKDHWGFFGMKFQNCWLLWLFSTNESDLSLSYFSAVPSLLFAVSYPDTISAGLAKLVLNISMYVCVFFQVQKFYRKKNIIVFLWGPNGARTGNVITNFQSIIYEMVAPVYCT